MFSDLKWISFPERVIYMKAIQMFETIRGDQYLNTLDRLLLFISSDIHERLLRSSSNFQLYIQIQFNILRRVNPNDQGHL